MSKDSALTNLELKPSDTNIMIRFVGELNENLKFVEKTFNVKIFQNGNNLKNSTKILTLYYAKSGRISTLAESIVEIVSPGVSP